MIWDDVYVAVRVNDKPFNFVVKHTGVVPTMWGWPLEDRTPSVPT